MQEGESLNELAGTKAFNENTIKNAVKLVFKGKQLESHAQLEINKTLSKWEENKPQEPKKKDKTKE